MNKLTIHLATKRESLWAKRMVINNHYLHSWPHPLSRPMAYVIKLDHSPVGLVVVGTPHASRNQRWWGYPGLRSQWQVVDLSRIWLDPRLQQGGDLCSAASVPGFYDRKGTFRPTTITDFVIPSVLSRVQKDRVSMWPPVYLAQGYHITLAVSYHDPSIHKGTIYQLSGAQPMYTDLKGNPVPGSSGKFGWCWPLSEPEWEWRQIEILQPRTLRMGF